MFNRQASCNCFHTSFSATCKQTTEELPKHREEMMSEFYHHHKQQLLQINSSLMRYRSVPDSLLAISVRGVEQGSEDFFPQSSSPEPENIFSRFKTCTDEDLACSDLHTIEEKPSAAAESVPEKNGFCSVPQMFYQADSMPSHVSAAVDESPYQELNSIVVDSQLARNCSNGSNLMRHSSSPAGLFSPLTAENGYAVMRDVGNFRAGNVSNGVATASTSRLKNQVSISPRQASAPQLLFQISEMESESMGTSNSDDGSLGNGNGIGRCYVPEFPMSTWEESPLENFSCLRRVRDINGKTSCLISSENQHKGDTGNFASGLNHQFSFPKTKSELAAMEKFGQFQDSVPCKIRAKRGCATHPRSIAERVRRTRISERMRKLQELVPNMDKQTNTADMLALAVEYIKDLQKQVKTLTDDRAKCSCLSNQNRKPHLTSAT